MPKALGTDHDTRGQVKILAFLAGKPLRNGAKDLVDGNDDHET